MLGNRSPCDVLFAISTTDSEKPAFVGAHTQPLSKASPVLKCMLLGHTTKVLGQTRDAGGSIIITDVDLRSFNEMLE